MKTTHTSERDEREVSRSSKVSSKKAGSLARSSDCVLVYDSGRVRFVGHESYGCSNESVDSSQGLYLLDAFRAMDYDRNGLIDCSELWGGLTYLGMEVTFAQVYDIMQTIEPSRVGLISFDDFQRALQLLEMTARRSRRTNDVMVEGAVKTIPKIKPRKMKELHLIEKMHKQANRLSPEVLKTVKIKVKAISYFKRFGVRSVRARSARISIVSLFRVNLYYSYRINHITLTPTLTSTHS